MQARPALTYSEIEKKRKPTKRIDPHCTTARYGDAAAAVGDYLARNFRAYKPGAPQKVGKILPDLLLGHWDCSAFTI